MIAAQFLGVGGPKRPTRGQGRFISVGGGGVLLSHRNRHRDDKREEAVVPRPLAVQTLGIGGTPRSVGLLNTGGMRGYALRRGKTSSANLLATRS